MTTIPGRLLVPGIATAPLLVLAAPLSLWGGIDLDDGTIIDATHPQRGQVLAGRVVAMPAARGSSSSSSALVEAVRRGVAPAAIVLAAADPILVIGSLVAAELYGRGVPILLLAATDWMHLVDGMSTTVDRHGLSCPR